MRPMTFAIVLALGIGCARPDATTDRGTAAASEHFATTPDSVRLYYRVAGRTGPVILAPFALFHGTALDPLAARYRVVTYDPRGRGRSEAVDPSKVSLDKLLLDFETVRAAVGAEQVAIIGWSGGGMESFVYALRYPSRVSRIVQLAPVAPRITPWGDSMMADRARRTDPAAQAGFDARLAAGAFGSDSVAWCRAADSVSAPALMANPGSAPRTPDVCVHRNEHPSALSRYFGGLFGSIAGFDWRDSLAAVTIPRLVIHGARDNTPLEGNQEWVTGQPNARLLVIEEAGHWPHYERPTETLEAIDTFLRGGWPAKAK